MHAAQRSGQMGIKGTRPLPNNDGRDTLRLDASKRSNGKSFQTAFDITDRGLLLPRSIVFAPSCQRIRALGA